VIIKFITSGIDSGSKSYIEQKTSLIAKESKDPKDHQAIDSCSGWVKATPELHCRRGCFGHVFESEEVLVA
jgi:hypothetical protein